MMLRLGALIVVLLIGVAMTGVVAEAGANDACRGSDYDHGYYSDLSKQAGRCIGRFSEGLASITLDGRDGYIDREGRMVIPPRYCRSHMFYNGLALAYDGCNNAGYIDAKGDWAIPPDFSSANEFGKADVATVRLRDYRHALIDRTGAVVRELESGTAVDWTGFHAGLAKAKRIRPDILAHVDGRMLELPADVLHLEHYDEQAGVFVGRRKGDSGVGLLDAQLRWIGEERFHILSAFNGDAAAASDEEGRWGLVGADGKHRTPFQYTRLDAAAPGLWLATLGDDDAPMLIDARGTRLVAAVGEHLQQPFGHWFVHQLDDEKVELIRGDGKRIRHGFGPEPAYINSFDARGPVLKVRVGGTGLKRVWSSELINQDGRRLLSPLPLPNGKSNFFHVEPVWSRATDDRVALPLALLRAYTLGDEPPVTADPDALGIVTASGVVRMNPQWLEFPHDEGGLEGPVVVQAAQGYGLIDGEGEWLAQPIYEKLWPFQQGWAVAQRGGKRYLLNADGREYEVPDFARELPQEGFFALTTHDDEAPWGPANFYDLAAGRFLLEEGVDNVRPFRGGLAPARKGQAWGLVDNKGNWRVPAQCTSISPRGADLWGASCERRTGGRDSLLASDGVALTAEPWRTLLLAHHGAESMPMGKAVVLGDGTALHPEMIKQARAIGGGWAHVSLQEMEGFVNARGDWVIAPDYRIVGDFSSALQVAVAYDGRDYFLIDPQGLRVFGPSGFIGDVSDDGMFYTHEHAASRTAIHHLGTGRLFDVPGEVYPDFGDGRIVYSDFRDHEKIVLDYAGRRILTVTDDDRLSSYAEGLALRQDGDSDRFSYIDRHGKPAFKGSYLYATLFREGRAVVMDEQGYRLIDQQGNTVVRVGEECGREVLLDPKGRRTWPAADEPVCRQRMD